MKTLTLVAASICIAIGSWGVAGSEDSARNSSKFGGFPFQVSVLGSNRQHVCEGVLVSTKHVLSDNTCISRCTDLLYPELITQKDVADSMNIELSGTQQLIDVDTFTLTFEEENSTESGFPVVPNELVVITLKEEIVESNGVKIITLPQVNLELPTGTKVIVGSREDHDLNGSASSSLERLMLRIASQEDCRISYPNISSTQSCARFDRSIDTCQVDIGSPIVYKDLIIGIVSVRIDKCVPENLVIFRQVSKFVPWISSKLT